MNRNNVSNIATCWEYIEAIALEHESERIRQAREEATSLGFEQSSAAQADFLALQARQINAHSAIVLGTGAVVETLAMLAALDATGDGGQLTAVDSSTQGADMIRRSHAATSNGTSTKLRVVNAKSDVFLPRLNANDYDMIVVGGDVSNYDVAFDEAYRLLRPNGMLLITDAMATESSHGKGGLPDPSDRSDKALRLRQLIKNSEEEERFQFSLVPIGTGLLIAIRQ